ncbi:MAG: saccharopine dehydrogenase NADP-binding domain-containing protein [Anaerolineae bacterium]|nr:saccharopine dehydrogenase NADP-binding domain-containing protein [Phycisphaerae bacterium]
MHRVLLLGAGKIGGAIARFLNRSGDFDVLVTDVDDNALNVLSNNSKIQTLKLDASDHGAIVAAAKGRDSLVSAMTFSFNPGIAKAALESGASYFDLTEDVETTKTIKEIGKQAKPGQIFMPQCGLAPGFVSIAANDLAQGFDKLDEVRLRVGALPQFPTNEMKYNLTWSTDGLINEYGNACEAIHEGEMIEVLPLEGIEHFSLDGVEYEAFNTSGGVGTLCETLAGKVRSLNYKTIRYRGHRDLMAFLMNELRLNARRDVLKDILERSVPITPQDVVLIFCTVKGWKGRHLMEVTDARKIYAGEFMGEMCSAIQITTAASMCAVVDLHAQGKLPKQGFVRQEQVALDDFLANRFGRSYAYDMKSASARTTSAVTM